MLVSMETPVSRPADANSVADRRLVGHPLSTGRGPTANPFARSRTALSEVGVTAENP